MSVVCKYKIGYKFLSPIKIKNTKILLMQKATKLLIYFKKLNKFAMRNIKTDRRYAEHRPDRIA